MTASGLGTTLAYRARSTLHQVHRLPILTGVLTPLGQSSVENFLLVGSDSRVGAEPNDPDFGGIGDATSTTGQRSDTIMVMRYDRAAGTAALLSLPRDLWVEIGSTGRKNRINSAYSDGPEVLVATVQQALGIPLHHYVEVDFQGFKRLVDAIGGVDVCFEFPARDGHTGLQIDDPGCQRLGGVAALQYARSRYYEEFRDGEWRVDGTADLGRTARQQDFVTSAIHQVAGAVGANPFRAAGVLSAVVDSIAVDADLDLTVMARELRAAAGAGVQTFPLPVQPDTIKGKAVLTVQVPEALPVIAYFQGPGPVPGS